MKYSFRLSNKQIQQTHRKTIFRLAGRSCPKEEKPILIDIASLFISIDTPLLKAPRKERKTTLIWARFKAAVHSLLSKISSKTKARRKRELQSPSLLLGLLSAALTVTLVSGLAVLLPYLIKYSGNYETVEVPDFTLLSYADILNSDDERFSFIIESFENTNASPGDVISQTPRAGALRRVYGKHDKLTVTLTVCAEKKTFTLSETLCGSPLRDTLLIFKNQGIPVKITEDYSDTVPKGCIISSSCKTGDSLSADSEVSLTVSLGKRIILTTLPSLEGLSEADAIARIESLGLVVGKISYAESDTSAGNVVSQSVPPYSSLPLGSSISLTISLGTHQAKRIPDLYGMTLSEAEAELRRYGIVLGEVYYLDTSIKNPTVVDQTPKKDTTILSSTVSVDIYLGK